MIAASRAGNNSSLPVDAQSVDAEDSNSEDESEDQICSMRLGEHGHQNFLFLKLFLFCLPEVNIAFK